jgi:hypothetical protein
VKTIVSQKDLFRGQLIEEPRRAKVIYRADGEPMYVCPNCGHTDDADGCDVIGAEAGCLFCCNCHAEFQT